MKEEKEIKEKTDAIKKACKDIQVAVNNTKATLHHCRVDAYKEEGEGNNRVQIILAQGGIPQPELMISITDPEKNPSPEDLESLQTPLDLYQRKISTCVWKVSLPWKSSGTPPSYVLCIL